MCYFGTFIDDRNIKKKNGGVRTTKFSRKSKKQVWEHSSKMSFRRSLSDAQDLRGWGDDAIVNCFTLQLEDPSSNPQYSYKKLGIAAHVCSQC